jgi:hypothetical protein
VIWLILVSSYIGTHKNGNSQASLDMDVDRLILLERVENGETEVAPDEIPF